MEGLRLDKGRGRGMDKECTEIKVTVLIAPFDGNSPFLSSVLASRK